MKKALEFMWYWILWGILCMLIWWFIIWIAYLLWLLVEQYNIWAPWYLMIAIWSVWFICWWIAYLDTDDKEEDEEVW